MFISLTAGHLPRVHLVSSTPLYIQPRYHHLLHREAEIRGEVSLLHTTPGGTTLISSLQPAHDGYFCVVWPTLTCECMFIPFVPICVGDRVKLEHGVKIKMLRPTSASFCFSLFER